MATSTTMPGDFNDSELLNYVIRMVVPMRREFGRTLDVSHFMHDFVYAREILDAAKASEDARLREYAGHLENTMFGPRKSPVAAPNSADAPKAPASTVKYPEPADPETSEAVMRARLMSKYKSGLR